jgi:hypothetical protein
MPQRHCTCAGVYDARMRSLAIALLLGVACSNGSHPPSATEPPAPPLPAPAAVPSVAIDAPAPAPAPPDASFDASPPPAPPNHPPPTPPPTPPPPPNDPTACTSSDECEIHCPVAHGCCDPTPCGCRQAINRASRAAIDAEYGRTCERRRCPIVDCKMPPRPTAECKNGHCVATRTLEQPR